MVDTTPDVSNKDQLHCKTRGVIITLLESKYYPCKRSNPFWGRNYSRNKGNLYDRGRIQRSNLTWGKFYPVWDKFYSCYGGRKFGGN
jgi:hypothetical protein